MENPLRRKVRAMSVVFRQLGRLGWSTKQWRAVHGLAPVLEAVSQGSDFPSFHYAQDAEDTALLEILPETGFYIDIGAHHPERFSVTKVLYDRGWSGVNIDVTPEMTPGGGFARRRPRDINIYGLVGKAGSVEFYRFSEPALSTADYERAQFLIESGERCESVEKLPSRPLREYLELHGKTGTPIDLLSVDVEGTDLQVLESLDWEAQSIGAVLVEIGKPAWSVTEDSISIFLAEKGLLPVLVFLRSVLYLPENSAGYDHFRK